MAEKTLQRALDAVALELDASKETSTVVDFGLAAAGTSTPLITQGGADSGWHEVFSLSDGVLLIQAWMGATARLVVNRMWIQTQSNINLSGMALSLGAVEGVGTYAFGEGELALDWCARCGIQPPPSQGGTWSPSTPIANAIRLVREIQLGEVEVKNGKYGISFYFTTPLIIEPGQNIALLCNDPRRNRFGLEATYNQNSPILHIGFNRDGALNEVVSWNNAVYRVILADFSASLPVVYYDEGSLFADIITVDGKKSIMTYRLDGEGNLVFIDLGLKSKDVIVVKKFLAVTPNDGGLIVCSDASVRLFKENKKLFEERVVDAADAGGLLRAQKPAGATDIAGFFGYDDDNAPILKRLSTDGDGKFKVNGDSATFKRNKAGAKEIQLLSDAGANSGIAMDEYVPPATDNHYAQKNTLMGKFPNPQLRRTRFLPSKGKTAPRFR